MKTIYINPSSSGLRKEICEFIALEQRCISDKLKSFDDRYEVIQDRLYELDAERAEWRGRSEALDDIIRLLDS